MSRQSRTVDSVIAELASGTHGVVTWRSLLGAGLSEDQIRDRTRRGTLIRVHRGVYRVGHAAPSVKATFIAAVLACGDEAFLSGRAAAHLLGLIRGGPPVPEVTCPTERRVTGVTTRRARKALHHGDATLVAGIRTTSAARTVVDLAREMTEPELARVCHEAGVLHKTTPADIEEVLSRRPSAPGAKKLRRVIHGTPVTLSKLESSFVALLQSHGLPLPTTNKLSGGRRVDCRWPDQRLVVELDGYAFHNSRHSWEQDRARERRARAAGYEHRRYSWRDVVEEPRPTVRELQRLLASPPS